MQQRVPGFFHWDHYSQLTGAWGRGPGIGYSSFVAHIRECERGHRERFLVREVLA